MTITLTSAKGGSGATVVAAALAVLRSRDYTTTLTSEGPDMLAVLGVAGPPDESVWINETLRYVGQAENFTGDIHDGRPLPGAENFLVTRACYLALRRASSCSMEPYTGVILIAEPGRALDAHDVAHCLDRPVMATIPFDPAISRAVDAGLLACRLPKSLSTALTPLLNLIGAT